MEGLGLSLTGISVTFAALGLVVVVMLVLDRIFRARPPVSDEKEPEEKPPASALARDTEDEEIVAAIAVALSHLRLLDIRRSGLGATLEDEHGSWWVMGRLQQRSVNTLQTRRGRK